MEFLVLLACSTGKGCSETVSLYSFHNPALIANVRDLELSARRQAGPVVVNFIGPGLGLLSGQSAVFQIVQNVNLNVSKSNLKLEFKKEF